MTRKPAEPDWSATTWEGNRRAQLRRALSLTLRERLRAAEGLSEVSERFEQMRRSGHLRTRGTGG